MGQRRDDDQDTMQFADLEEEVALDLGQVEEEGYSAGMFDLVSSE
jgi:hypothetical protein